MHLQIEWKTVWILIRWLHQKAADLDLQCFLKIKRGCSALSGSPENDCFFKGIGKHSSSNCPPLNFDRSTVSIRLYMDYVDKIKRMQNLELSLYNLMPTSG